MHNFKRSVFKVAYIRKSPVRVLHIKKGGRGAGSIGGTPLSRAPARRHSPSSSSPPFVILLSSSGYLLPRRSATCWGKSRPGGNGKTRGGLVSPGNGKRTTEETRKYSGNDCFCLVHASSLSLNSFSCRCFGESPEATPQLLIHKAATRNINE